MRNLILSAFLMLCISLCAQVQTINSQLRLNNVQPGAPSDSVLVRGSNGIVKFRPASEIGGGQPFVPSLEQVTDVDNVTRNFIDVRNQSGTERSMLYAGRAEFNNYSELNNAILSRAEISTRDNGASILVNSDNSLLSVNAGTRPEIFGSDGGLENILDFGLPQNVGVIGTATRFYLPELPYESGGQILATQAYVDDAVSNGGGSGAGNLESVLSNGNMSMYSISLVDDINNPTQTANVNKDNINFSASIERPDPAQIDVSLGLDFGGDTPGLTIRQSTDNGETLFSLLAGNGTALLNARTPDTSILLDFGTPNNVGNSGGDTIFYFPNLPNGSGGQVLATEAYVNNIIGSSGGSSDLQTITDNGSTTTNPIQVAELGLYDIANDSYATMSFNDGSFGVFNDGGVGFNIDVYNRSLMIGNPNGASGGSWRISPGFGASISGMDQVFLLPDVPTGILMTDQTTRNLINGVALAQSGTVVSNQDINVYVFTGAGTFAPTNTMPVGKIYKIRNNHTALITIDPSGSTQINSSLTHTVSPGKTLEILWTGSNYITIGDY